MSAIRLARAATGRDEIVKVDGCYHGHADSLLVRAGSGVLTLGIPGSPGVPRALAELTHVVPFNDEPALARLLDARGAKIACLILEPIAGNMGVVAPHDGYLRAVRDLTTRARRPAHRRRGDDRLPRASRRGPGALRCDRRPDDASAR